MDAGWVNHLLAQARHLEEILPVRDCPKSVELKRRGTSWRPVHRGWHPRASPGTIYVGLDLHRIDLQHDGDHYSSIYACMIVRMRQLDDPGEASNVETATSIAGWV